MKMKSCIAAMVVAAVGLAMTVPALAQSPAGMKLYITSSGDLNLDQGWLTAMTNHGTV